MKDKYEEIIKFIKLYFKETNGMGAVIGISGGKDSTVVAKLLVDAIGKENVFGVLMPNHVQNDISDSLAVCKEMGIGYRIVNIGLAYDAVLESMDVNHLSDAAKINIAPRLRMTTLYAIAQTLGYRVAGTGNRSEQFTGWCTKWGDMASDINPISHLTCTEVIELGDYMGLPYDLVHKTPADGLSGASDEDKFGFTYEQLDAFIMNGAEDSVYTGDVEIPEEICDLIREKYKYSRHKFAPYTILNYGK